MRQICKYHILFIYVFTDFFTICSYCLKSISLNKGTFFTWVEGEILPSPPTIAKKPPIYRRFCLFMQIHSRNITRCAMLRQHLSLMPFSQGCDRQAWSERCLVQPEKQRVKVVEWQHC